MYIFFDTETTGLPKKWNAKITDLDNWPRVIQLAFIVTDDNLNIIDEYCELIYPDGWIIPEQKFWIDNGYYTEINLKDGVPMSKALIKLCDHINKSKYIVAHNMSFDHPVICAEMLRYNIRPLHPIDKICTMKSTTDFMDLPRKKWPKLEELHIRLFNNNFDNAHDALADVRATLKCFKHLKENNLISNWK